MPVEGDVTSWETRTEQDAQMTGCVALQNLTMMYATWQEYACLNNFMNNFIRRSRHGT